MSNQRKNNTSPTTGAPSATLPTDSPADAVPDEAAPAGFYDRLDEFGPGDDEELFPVVQWNHEEGAFEIPLKNLPPSLTFPDSFRRAEIAHTGGTEEVLLVKQLDLAVIAVRERLEQRVNKATVVLPAGVGKVGEDKVYSRKHVLAVCRQFVEAGYPDPVLLSVKSTTSADLGTVLRALLQFRQAASWAASEKAGQRTVLPRWAFYCPLQAGQTYRAEEGAKITPLGHGLPDKPTETDFAARLIPPAVRQFIQSYLERAKQWERDPRFCAGGQVLGDLNGEAARPTAPTEDETAPTAAPVDSPRPSQEVHGVPRNRAPRSERPRPETPDFLRMTVPFGTKTHPEYRGMPLGDLLASAEGRRFVEYLATHHEAQNAQQEQVVRGARALAAAGLTRGA